MMLKTLMTTAMLLLAGCQPMPGGDRDRHGCLGSAGYQWCPATQSCERPWELAEGKGFDRSQQGFLDYCVGRVDQ